MFYLKTFLLKDPQWTSLNFGVLICIRCSGVHREFGTHISRVRSVTLDNWSQVHITIMMHFGNANANSLWEARLGQDDM